MRRFTAEDIYRKSDSRYQKVGTPVGKILVVACQHGDEQFGLAIRKLVEADQRLSRHVDTVVGNPRAVRKNVRFTEFNMNRAYGDPEGNTHEHRQARRVQKIAQQYPLVIDEHQGTLTAINGLVIAADLNPDTRRIINVLESEHIALFSPRIASMGLIGNLRRGRVSIEYSRRETDLANARQETQEALHLLAAGKQKPPKLRQVFLVDDIVPRSFEVDPETDYNFRALPESRGFGILFGDPAYANESYHGFAAHTVYTEAV